MSGFLNETNETYENLISMMSMVSMDTELSSAHGSVLKELHETLVGRKRVFVKRSTEMARKQAWYRSVALGQQRRDLLCWMMNAVVRTLTVNEKNMNISHKINVQRSEMFAPFQMSANEGNLFSFVPEFYVNIMPILLDTLMDFSFHDLNVQNDLSGDPITSFIQPNPTHPL